MSRRSRARPMTGAPGRRVPVVRRTTGTRPAPPAAVRHVVVAGVAGLLVLIFWRTRTGWDPMHAWNRAFADASLLLLVATLAAGPLARLWPPTARLVLWRRELGIWTVFAAVGHVLIVLTGWVEWEPFRLFYSVNPFTRDWALDQGFALGNLLGIVALVYSVVLLATSNDASIRLLGGSTWKFVQQNVSIVWALVALHTAYFLYFHFVTFHRPPVPTNWMQGPFLVLVLVLFVLRTAALVVTMRRRRTVARDGAATGVSEAE
jgi:sulfoxide reductase heme-binding subunit YedZ